MCPWLRASRSAPRCRGGRARWRGPGHSPRLAGAEWVAARGGVVEDGKWQEGYLSLSSAAAKSGPGMTAMPRSPRLPLRQVPILATSAVPRAARVPGASFACPPGPARDEAAAVAALGPSGAGRAEAAEVPGGAEGLRPGDRAPHTWRWGHASAPRSRLRPELQRNRGWGWGAFTPSLK